MDEPKKLRAASFRVDFWALEQLLKLPEDHHIQRSICPSNEWNNPPGILLNT